MVAVVVEVGVVAVVAVEVDAVIVVASVEAFPLGAEVVEDVVPVDMVELILEDVVAFVNVVVNVVVVAESFVAGGAKMDLEAAAVFEEKYLVSAVAQSVLAVQQSSFHLVVLWETLVFVEAAAAVA